jgi:hypothetical protein
MRIRSRVPGLTPTTVGLMLEGLPTAAGYRVVVVPFRYRSHPHLSALTDFDEREIVLQLPEPFLPFGEVVPYGARRRPGKGLRFIWLTEGLTFRTPRQVLRFLYLHEWMHWYLKERLGRGTFAETACDRFALWHFRRPRVTPEDADASLRREPPRAWRSPATQSSR